MCEEKKTVGRPYTRKRQYRITVDVLMVYLIGTSGRVGGYVVPCERRGR